LIGWNFSRIPMIQNKEKIAYLRPEFFKSLGFPKIQIFKGYYPYQKGDPKREGGLCQSEASFFEYLAIQTTSPVFPELHHRRNQPLMSWGPYKK